MGAHCVRDGWIVVSFNVGSKGCFAMFFEVKFTVEDNFPRGVLVGYPGCGWDTVEPQYSELYEADSDLEGCVCFALRFVGVVCQYSKLPQLWLVLPHDILGLYPRRLRWYYPIVFGDSHKARYC